MQSPPPLTSVPSTPGPQLPGGYPRNSVVFNTNQWDRSAAESHTDMTSTAAATASNILAAAKTYLPSGVASYFPDVPPTAPTPSTIPSPEVHTPYPRDVPPLLNTDGSVATITSTGNFSTRAYAGSGSSRIEHAPDSPVSEYTLQLPPTETESAAVPEQEMEVVTPLPRPRATSGLKPSHPGVAHPSHPPLTHDHLPVDPNAVSVALSPLSPIPSSPPANSLASPASPASMSTPSTTSSASTAPSSPALSTPPSSPPSSPALQTKGSKNRFVSLRRGKAAAPASASPPPSSFHARGASLGGGSSSTSSLGTGAGGGYVRGASLDSSSPSPSSPNTTTTAGGETKAPKKKSLLRTLRGEAKLLTGRLRGDPAKVEEGRKMLNGERA